MSSQNNYRETFWEIAFWCVTSSHRVSPFPSWNSLLTLFSWILQRYIFELIEGQGENGIIVTQQLKRSFLRNCIAMCECNSQSYTFLFSDQFVNTVFWKSAICYFIAQWTWRWQRKYPQMKTRKKLSQKLLGDVWIHLTELHLCFVEQSINTVFEAAEKGFLGSHWGLRWQRTFHPFKTWKKLSENRLSDLWIHLIELQPVPQEAVC